MPPYSQRYIWLEPSKTKEEYSARLIMAGGQALVEVEQKYGTNSEEYRLCVDRWSLLYRTNIKDWDGEARSRLILSPPY
jgi:hypothetical protein